jgi:hypothetical protein
MRLSGERSLGTLDLLESHEPVSQEFVFQLLICQIADCERGRPSLEKDCFDGFATRQSEQPA